MSRTWTEAHNSVLQELRLAAGRSENFRSTHLRPKAGTKQTQKAEAAEWHHPTMARTNTCGAADTFLQPQWCPPWPPQPFLIDLRQMRLLQQRRILMPLMQR